MKDSTGQVLGRVIVAKPIKNRLGGTFVEARIAMLSGWGADNVWTLFQELKRREVITTGGSWAAMNIDGQVYKFQGWLGLRRLIEKEPELYLKLVTIWRGW